MRVRAISGQVRDDAWIQRQLMPLGQRVLEAGRFAAIGLFGGMALLVVPLLHLLGVLFALALTGVAMVRLRTRAVVDAAGGVCPRCEHAGNFFAGLGRRRFRLPLEASCEKCGVELTLYRP